MKMSDLAAQIRDLALQLPETDEAFPWGESALRVRGKAFVFMRLENQKLSFSVKLPRSRARALELPFVEPTHYGLGKHGWVTVDVPRPTQALLAQFKEWVLESYRAVAPRRVAALLDATAASRLHRAPSRSRRAKPASRRRR